MARVAMQAAKAGRGKETRVDRREKNQPRSFKACGCGRELW